MPTSIPTAYALPFSSLLSAFDLLLVLCFYQFLVLFSFMGLFVDLIALFCSLFFFFFVSVKVPFFMCFCMFSFAFTICQSFVCFLFVGWFCSFFSSPSVPHCLWGLDAPARGWARATELGDLSPGF